MDLLIWHLYPRRVYTAKRIQEHLDSHLNKEENTQKNDLSTSLLPDILS